MSRSTTINISIITPIYNHAQYFQQYLDSVIPQLIEGDEIVLVDDASTDNLHEIMAGLRAKWKKWLVFNTASEHRGVSICRNVAMELAKNEWVKFLDADDRLFTNALDGFRESVACSTAKVHVGKQGFFGRILPANPIKAYQLRGRIYTPNIETIETRNPMVPSMTLAHRPTVMEVGGFNEKIQFEEDWDLWLKIYRKYGLEAFKVCDFISNRFNLLPNNKDRFEHERIPLIDGVFVREYFQEEYGICPKDMPKDRDRFYQHYSEEEIVKRQLELEKKLEFRKKQKSL